MALSASEIDRGAQKVVSSQARESSLYLATPIEPLRNPERQTFYNIINLLGRNERMKLLIAFPPSIKEVTRVDLQNAVYPQYAGNARSEIKRLITSSNFAAYIEQGADQNDNKKTHKLTKKGVIARQTAQIASDFFRKYQEAGIDNNLFGDNRNNIPSSAAIRSEVLFALVLAGNKGVRKFILETKLGCSYRTLEETYTFFKALGIIEVDNQFEAHLTDLGKAVIRDLLLPIAELTAYPADRIVEIRTALGEVATETQQEQTSIIDITTARRQLRHEEPIQPAIQVVEQAPSRRHLEEVDVLTDDTESDLLSKMHRYPKGLSEDQTYMVFSYREQGLSLRKLFLDPKFLATFPQEIEGQLQLKRVKEAYMDTIAHGEDLNGFYYRCNMRLVAHIARRYLNRGLPYIDLLQEGGIGLTIAIEKFDYKRGTQFSTHAGWWIREAMGRATDNTSRTVRLPVYQETNLRQIYAAAQSIGLSHPYDNLEAVVAQFNTEAKKPITFNEAEALLTAQTPVGTLDTPLNDDEGDSTSMYDILTDENAVDPAMLVERRYPGLLEDLADILTYRELFALEAGFGVYAPEKGLTTEEAQTHVWIGKQLNISRERVRQLKESAFIKIRENKQFMSHWRSVFEN